MTKSVQYITDQGQYRMTWSWTGSCLAPVHNDWQYDGEFVTNRIMHPSSIARLHNITPANAVKLNWYSSPGGTAEISFGGLWFSKLTYDFSSGVKVKKTAVQSCLIEQQEIGGYYEYFEFLPEGYELEIDYFTEFFPFVADSEQDFFSCSIANMKSTAGVSDIWLQRYGSW